MFSPAKIWQRHDQYAMWVSVFISWSFFSVNIPVIKGHLS